MIEKSGYLQEALLKPWFHYFMILSTISPIHMFGMTLLIVNTIIYTRNRDMKSPSLKSKLSRNVVEAPHFLVDCWALVVWPLAFILGHVVVGVCGGGYQTRFILPIIPATSIIAALGLEVLPEYQATASALVAIGAMHLLFYGVMFYPLFCDFEFNVFDIIQIIVDSTQYIPESQKEFAGVFKYMEHHGLRKRLQL